MKNESEKEKSKDRDRGKISVLKKKLSSVESTPDELEKKSRKGKKLKKNDDVKTNKRSSFVRKFNFSKYMSAPADISRASSSKSMTESDTSDRLSSGYLTLTPTSLKRHDDIEDTQSGDATSAISASPTSASALPIPMPVVGGNAPQPVSVTPYAISIWRSPDNNVLTSTLPLHSNKEFMESKLSEHEDNRPIEIQNESNKLHSVRGSVPDIKEDKAEETIENKTENTSEDQISLATEPAAEVMPAFGNLVMDLSKDQPDITSNISQPSLERKEHLYKILVIGELGTGKTSIIKRYVHQFFSQHYRATIGVDFALKVLNWDANTVIRLQLWDIAGQERFGNMTRVYYKDAVGAFIVFDVTRVATFEAVDKWKQDLDSKVQLPDGSSIPCVLLGNKCDQQKEGLVNTPNRMDEYCKEKGFSGWFETSAKENINIEDAARFLVNKILLNDKLLHSSDLNKDNDRIAIDDKGHANGHNLKSSKNCSC